MIEATSDRRSERAWFDGWNATRVAFRLVGWAALLIAVGAGRAAWAWEEPLPEPTGPVILEVIGEIGKTNDGQSARLDRTLLAELPAHDLRTTTSVTDGVNVFDGFLMRDLLERLGATGDTVIASALNDYVIEIPMSDFERFDVLVATHMDGSELLARDKGPLWIVYPRDDHDELQDIRYDYRWVWQLMTLEVR